MRKKYKIQKFYSLRIANGNDDDADGCETISSQKSSENKFLMQINNRI